MMEMYPWLPSQKCINCLKLVKTKVNDFAWFLVIGFIVVKVTNSDGQHFKVLVWVTQKPYSDNDSMASEITHPVQ